MKSVQYEVSKSLYELTSNEELEVLELGLLDGNLDPLLRVGCLSGVVGCLLLQLDLLLCNSLEDFVVDVG